jgi:hypothetical protein
MHLLRTRRGLLLGFVGASGGSGGSGYGAGGGGGMMATTVLEGPDNGFTFSPSTVKVTQARRSRS